MKADMIDPLVLSREGTPLVFVHANGYPPQAYRSFLRPFLADYQLTAYYLRPFWPGSVPGELQDWRSFRDDFLRYLDSREDQHPGTSRQVIGVGHSLGAMTILMAAISDPSHFRALALIEPVIFKPWIGEGMRLAAPYQLTRRIIPLIRNTLKRKDRFPDREAMFQNYREKAVFSGLSDQVLRDYVSGLAEDHSDGSVGLKYSPQWEVKIYETAGLADGYVWEHLDQVTCPVLILRGAKTTSLTASTLRRLVAGLPVGKGLNVPGAGHLLPLERPEETARIILDFLRSLT
jgi:pimeloyl-ACP methyl ester carboxylesterase